MSDLGGGKTTFVRGLARGLGSRDPVRSPSFTISNEYRSKDLVLHHLDFYRLREPGIMRDELAEILIDPRAVVAIEWGSIIEDVLPKQRVEVSIKATGDNEREIVFKYPASLTYLMKNT